MLEKITELFSKQLGCDPDEISEDSLIMEDLGADSLDIVEILMALEDDCGVVFADDDIPSLRTIGDISSYIETNM